MSSILIGWPIYSDVWGAQTPVGSGGSWLAALPLSNLQVRDLSEIARSTNALAASTQMDWDLGVARAIGVVALPKPTITLAGTVRVRGYTGAGHTTNVYDSGTLTFGPSGQTTEDLIGLNVAFVVFPNVTCRYWFIEIVDTANPAGYVDLSRLVIAGAYQPTINVEYGATLTLESDTTRVLTDGGAAKYKVGPQRRVLTGVLGQIPESEAFGNWWKIAKQTGTSGQVWVSFDPGDTEPARHNQNFLAVFKQPNALAYPYFARRQAAFSFVEEI